jgi:hypothetical protein
MSAPETSEKSLEIPIEALPRVYWAVVSASTSNERQWQELCAGRLSADCTACRIKISGSELRQLATAHAPDLLKGEENPKLDRLRQNYCARNTCEGRFYRVTIQPDSERHFASIKDQLLSTTPEVRETDAPKIRKPLFSSSALSRLRPMRLTILLLTGLVLFFVVRHWMYGSRIPLVQKKHEYRVIQVTD